MTMPEYDDLGRNYPSDELLESLRCDTGRDVNKRGELVELLNGWFQDIFDLNPHAFLDLDGAEHARELLESDWADDAGDDLVDELAGFIDAYADAAVECLREDGTLPDMPEVRVGDSVRWGDLDHGPAKFVVRYLDGGEATLDELTDPVEVRRLVRELL